MYDKTKVCLFVLTLIVSVGFFCSTGYFLYENNLLKHKLADQEKKATTATTQKGHFESTIVSFYRTLYTYQDNAKTVDLEKLNQWTDSAVYAELKKEIDVAQQGTPQQNIIRSSMIQSKGIEIVPFLKSAEDQLSYLVSVPILQKINGEETVFTQTEILSFDVHTQKIVQRQIILSKGSETNG
ncbi:hypothetical protein N4841_09395 [Enterococcus faecalis]|uniref:hypothetical protein n=1 Tax=Enterococcus faecalis TaxID=1351 RepID=UPI0021E09F4B|nr:hypothetical protein [Enterococcus faecalis]MCU9794454.1 hypothetical protein [Enterococcus faecalis]